MKGLLLFLSTAAVAGGILVGYLDHKKAPEPSSGTPETGVEVVPPPPPEKEVPTTPKKTTKPVPEPAAPKPEVVVPSEKELQKAIQDLEKLLLAENFKGASGIARKLVEQYKKNPEALALLDELRRAEKRVLAYELLTAPLAAREPPAKLFSILLDNGNTIVATEVTEQSDRYDVTYIQGGMGALKKDKIQSVSPLSRKTYLTRRAEEIRRRVEHMKDPLDLFFFGVRKCFREGLRREGFTLLDRLLLLPESAQVVMLYARDPDGKAVLYWEQSAGRIALERLDEPPAPPVVASRGPSRSGDEPGFLEPYTGLESPAMRRVGEIVGQAEDAYRGGETFLARTLAQSAAKLLYSLPRSDRRVVDLTRRLRIVLEKAMSD